MNETTIVAPSIEQDVSVENTLTSLDSRGLSTGGNEDPDSMIAEKSISADVDSLTTMMHEINSVSYDMESTASDDQTLHISTTSEDLDSWSTMSGGESEIESGYEYSDFDEAEPMEPSEFDSIAATGNSETNVVYTSEGSQALNKPTSNATDGVLQLLKQAVENGSAVVLDSSSLDADVVYQRSVAFSQSAPPSPVFKHERRKKVAADKSKEETSRELEVKEEETAGNEKKDSKTKKKKNFGDYNFSSPQGSLGVDELAKLLA